MNPRPMQLQFFGFAAGLLLLALLFAIFVHFASGGSAADFWKGFASGWVLIGIIGGAFALVIFVCTKLGIGP